MALAMPVFMSDEIKEILGESISDVYVKSDKSRKVQDYILKNRRKRVIDEIISIIPQIYDDIEELETDLTKLILFNPDKRNNICKTDESKVGALNMMSSFIAHYFDDYDDFCNTVKLIKII